MLQHNDTDPAPSTIQDTKNCKTKNKIKHENIYQSSFFSSSTKIEPNVSLESWRSSVESWAAILKE